MTSYPCPYSKEHPLMHSQTELNLHLMHEHPEGMIEEGDASGYFTALLNRYGSQRRSR